MNAPTSTKPAAAADALAAALPLTTPVQADRRHGRPGAGDLTEVVTASYVGSLSADVAVTLRDMDLVVAAAGSDSTVISAADVLRPALEAATAVLGDGVLGDTQVADAADLFADEATETYTLTSGEDVVGWFAIRMRGSATPARSARGPVSLSKLARINDVEMALTVEIGRTRMAVREVLDLEPGGVIELDRSAGAPADVLLNGRLIAHGEVVVVDQDYAVRITQILDTDEDVS